MVSEYLGKYDILGQAWANRYIHICPYINPTITSVNQAFLCVVGYETFFCNHYENMPIQIYWKFYHQKNEHFQIKNSNIFHISAQNSNEYLQSMFWAEIWKILEFFIWKCSFLVVKFSVSTIYVLSRIKKNNVYPSKPQFYCIKVGFKGVKII